MITDLETTSGPAVGTKPDRQAGRRLRGNTPPLCDYG